MKEFNLGGLNEKLQIWVLSDGKAGHENQSLGLAEAMGRKVDAEVRLLRMNMGQGVFKRVGQVVKETIDFERPDYVIGAGHGVHLALFWVARKYDARSIVLMKPSFPMSWFGCCVVPEHDFRKLPTSGCVILSKGALNRVVPCEGKREGKLILVGGASKVHGFDEEALIRRIREIAVGGGWAVADSRRTPDGFLEVLGREVAGLEMFPHEEAGGGWLAGRLASVEEVWVTEDSVSMIYEALTGGGRVGVIEMRRLREDARTIRGLEILRAEGYFSGSGKRLAEAERCAGIILEKRDK